MEKNGVRKLLVGNQRMRKHGKKLIVFTKNINVIMLRNRNTFYSNANSNCMHNCSYRQYIIRLCQNILSVTPLRFRYTSRAYPTSLHPLSKSNICVAILRTTGTGTVFPICLYASFIVVVLGK